MDEVSLSVPKPIIDSLPEDGQSTIQDMQSAVEGWESRINQAIASADDDREAAGYVADAVERFDARAETFDEFVPELRAWGQSPIYAIAWRNLYADLIEQIYQRDDIADELDRERNARLVEDGIRLSDQQ
jgi:recombinational DNA repair ATPase RecF